MRILFGTDGIRGIALNELTPELAYRTGQAAALVLTKELGRRSTIIIGKDTRRSGDMLESALSAGICSVGSDVIIAGVVPTPAIAYLVTKHADAGIVISASHNPSEHNGIKIFNADGYKLSDALEEEIEKIILDKDAVKFCETNEIGRVKYGFDLVDEYIEHIVSTVGGNLAGVSFAVDCANGASSAIAPKLFEKLGAYFKCINCDPDGENINDHCGSTHLESLRDFVVENELDFGVAFDGDADRCLIVDEKGAVLDGDRIMAALATYLKNAGRLPHDTFVSTVMSNLGLHAYAKENGLHIATANVGDRYVLETMQHGDYRLGGEQSGHIIMLDYATTGDGLLTSVQFISMLKNRGGKASELSEAVKNYPQLLINVKVPNSLKAKIAKESSVQKVIDQYASQLGENGRILVRHSGTEALVRVMVEGKNFDEVNEIAKAVAEAISARVDELPNK